MVEAAIAWRGELDILVNNAGIDLPGSILEATIDEWESQVAVNLRAPFFATQVAARHMVERGSGKVVNTVSTSGFVSSSTPNPIYDLTKGGLRQLTISAAVELAPLGVNVNGVAPGTVATELTTAVLDTPEKLARASSRIPRGTFGRPADIAAAVAFLASTTPTTSTATCSSSTAAGWPSDPGPAGQVGPGPPAAPPPLAAPPPFPPRRDRRAPTVPPRSGPGRGHRSGRRSRRALRHLSTPTSSP